VLNQFASFERRVEALAFNGRWLRQLSDLSKLNNQSSVTMRESLRNASFVAEMLDWGDKFVMAKDQTDLFVNNPNGFFDLVAMSTLDGQILVASLDTQGLFLIANSRMSILDTILNQSIRSAYLSDIASVVKSYSSGTNLETTINYLRHIFSAAQPEGVVDRAQLAFMLGVANHETNYFQTMEEYSSGTEYDRRVDLMNDVYGDGSRYKGRGFVQLTGKLRYFYYTAVKQLNVEREVINLYNNPSQASNPKIAAAILVDYLKYGKISIKADWEYSSTGQRPQTSLFTDLEMTSSPRSIGAYKFQSRGIASMTSEGLNVLSANYEKFASVAAIVNQYLGEDNDKVAKYSVNFFNKLGNSDPRRR
jgi:predicted chitinase